MITSTDLYLLDEYDEIIHKHVFENEEAKDVLSILLCYMFFYMLFFISVLGLLSTIYEQRIIKLEYKISDLEEEIDDLSPITFTENKTKDNEKWTMED